MDKLIAYLNSLDKARRADFASRCGTSEGYMRKASSTGQKFRCELCVRIERESSGEVTRQDLRDDWADVWPELIEQPNVSEAVCAPKLDRAAASDDTQPPAGTSSDELEDTTSGPHGTIITHFDR